ncbi:MAG TPA: DUF4352 domain-containing protein, partial [Bacillales bacterium]|nr:DUF4352 domain-containing protein [Bacillales bacterium]
ESSETATKAVTQDAEPTTGEITTGVEKNDTKPKEMTNDSGKKPEEEVKPSDEDLPPGVPDVSAIINVGEELRFPKIAGKKLPPNPNIFSAKLVNPPAKADLGKPEEGMKYVSIQLTFEYNNTSSRSIIVQYQPYYFYLYTNQAKKEDVDFTIIKKVDYEKARGRLGGKGSLTSVVTYEVKKDAKNLTLVVNTGYSPPSFHTGRIAVRINKMD